MENKRELLERLRVVKDYVISTNPLSFKTDKAIAEHIGYPQANFSQAFRGNERYKEKILVRPDERDIYYLIEAAGHSMNPIIRDKDWLRCKEINISFHSPANPAGFFIPIIKG